MIARRPLREVERAMAANVMGGRPQFDGLTADEVHEYQAQFVAEQLVRKQNEEREARAAHEAEREREVVGEKRGEGVGPKAIHYEDGPGGPIRLSFTILSF